MNRAGRVVLGLVTVLVLAPACGAATTSSTTPTSTPVQSGSPSTSDSGKLDPAVAMPDGFASDFPVYPGARLTRANQVTANGQTTWGMEWETLDNLTAVQSFYMSKLNQGDWTLTYGGSGEW